MTLKELLELFPDARQAGEGYSARCPAHEDRQASLSIAQKEDKLLLHCHAGCKKEAICAALNIQKADLFINPRRGGRGRIVKTYDYRNADGVLVYQVVRFEPKDFRQRRPNGKGGWIWNLKGTERVLYHLQ